MKSALSIHTTVMAESRPRTAYQPDKTVIRWTDIGHGQVSTLACWYRAYSAAVDREMALAMSHCEEGADEKTRCSADFEGAAW